MLSSSDKRVSATFLADMVQEPIGAVQDTGQPYLSPAEVLEKLELQIVNDSLVKPLLLCLGPDPNDHKLPCLGEYKNHGKNGSPNSFGAVRSSVECKKCHSRKRLGTALSNLVDAGKANEKIKEYIEQLNEIINNAAPTDKQRLKRKATEAIFKPEPAQLKLNFAKKITIENPKKIETDEKNDMEMDESATIRADNLDMLMDDTASAILENNDADNCDTADYYNDDEDDAVKQENEQLELVLAENEHLKKRIANLESEIVRLNVRVKNQADQLAKKPNMNATASRSNSRRRTSFNTEQPSGQQQQARKISYADVTRSATKPVPPKPGNEDRNRIRRMAAKKISDLSENEKKLILGTANLSTEKTPQVFHRIHVKVRPPRGSKYERSATTRQRMRQFLRLTGIGRHVTLSANIGKEVYELYVCDNALENFETSALQHNLTIIDDYDPSDFSYIINDEIRMAARNAAAMRIAHLLVKSKFINLRASIIQDYDSTTIGRAYELADKIHEERVSSWKHKYQASNLRFTPEPNQTLSLRERLNNKSSDNNNLFEKKTVVNDKLQLEGMSLNNEDKKRLHKAMTTLSIYDYAALLDLIKSGVTLESAIAKRLKNAPPGKGMLDRFFCFLPTNMSNPDYSLFEPDWPIIQNGIKLNEHELKNIILSTLLSPHELTLLENLAATYNNFEKAVAMRPNELIGSQELDRLIAFLPVEDYEASRKSIWSFITKTHPQALDLIYSHLDINA